MAVAMLKASATSPTVGPRKALEVQVVEEATQGPDERQRRQWERSNGRQLVPAVGHVAWAAQVLRLFCCFMENYHYSLYQGVAQQVNEEGKRLG